MEQVGTTFINARILIASRPTASIGAGLLAPKAGETATITFSFDQSVTLVSQGAVTVTSGTLGAITGRGMSCSATFTPTANTTTTAQITVGNGAFTAGPGLTNQDAAEANNTVGINIDTLVPTISIAAFSGPANGNQTAVITLSEDSDDFVLADLTLTNATATLTGSDTSYTAVLTPLVDGPVALSVAANTFADAAGNANTVSNEAP